LRGYLESRKARLNPLLILTHDFPDPDALAAAMGLMVLAREGFGIESKIAYRGAIGRMENRSMVRLLHIPVRKFRPAMLRQYAAVALVDTQPAFENNPFPASRRAALVIDQHPSEVPPAAELALVDPGCGASCVLVARALLDQGIPLSQRLATALAYGILTDTLNFFRAPRPDIVQTYLQVLPQCDMRKLARIQNPVRPKWFFSTLGKGIRDAWLYRTTLVAHLGAVDTPDRVSQVAEFLLSFRRVRWCLVTGRHQGRLHASLRSTRLDGQAVEILRDSVAHPNEAGGHGAIAGGSCRVANDAGDTEWTAREKALEGRLLRRLRVPSKIEPTRPFAH
jgi:nanoRNase/pAp phosphatase (c-di-AMP/oligoRNAs hydrolase)